MEKQENLGDKQQTKKDLIISYFLEGIHEVNKIAKKVDTQPSYVASVLQEEGFIKGYFDLYTSTKQSMNIYSKLFAHRLSFKDEKAAGRSVALLNRFYKKFKRDNDRVGQHHALSLALTMFHRALWINKKKEAKIFHNWLVIRLKEEISTTDQISTQAT